MTKSTKKAVTTPKNNIPSYDKICHIMSQSMWREGDQKEEISQLIDALQKIGYFKSFRPSENEQFSREKHGLETARKVKPRSKASYRHIKTYYKSPHQYKKERKRRKLCWLLHGKFKETQIADMLGVSVRTVIRDLNKVKPYHYRMFQAACRQIQESHMKKLRLEMEGMSLTERYTTLMKLMETKRAIGVVRKYLRHHQIITVDMTQLEYGIPKITFSGGKHSTLAFPHKIRIHVKAVHEGREFTTDVGGIELTQTSGGLW